jgi:hypothetical protein
MTPETASFAEFAALAGYRRASYVHQLAREGKLVLVDGDPKRVRVAESFALLAAVRDAAKDGVRARHAAARAEPPRPDAASAEDDQAPEDSASPAPAPIYDGHALRRSKALADKEEELAAKARRERLVEEGKLLARDEVEPAVSLAFGHLRQALEALPYQLAPELASIADEQRIAAVLVDRFEQLLQQASRALAKLAAA